MRADDEGTPPEARNVGCIVAGVLLAAFWAAFVAGVVLFVWYVA